jgi:hypothetical protein
MSEMGLVSRVSPVQTALRNCTRDEGRSFEVGNQVLGSDRSLQRVLQKRADQRDPAVSSDKSALLWMYGREIASFDTPTFSKKLGEIITRATSMPQTSSRGFSPTARKRAPLTSDD